MWFKMLLRALLPTFAPIPEKRSIEADAVVAHKIVRSYARGNVNLQRGRYMTADKLEARKRQLALHSF
ncbi:hypothetical protein PSCICO_36600 [Pseudomonas cichorii]|uniref:Uncharacterized protein n=1 Tax=Pseudomonas serbiensis TaxID=3064350 RepID=A0ABT9CK03_9PSED|nr:MULTISPECIES: hypothetical protein [Pseudomonas]MDO7925814.1 hypothetical protein [Pseudomonas sp. KFB-138]GFM88261.1 hypothetical protein PSCICO_36600 [Pseudomonas cichorii]